MGGTAGDGAWPHPVRTSGDAYVTQALRAGASGFLLKEATADQLTGAVRVIASGEAILAPAVTRRLLEQMAQDPARRG
jgi:DNA-binding NarL/FixJ family response regulator